jgi:hypothetical protein
LIDDKFAMKTIVINPVNKKQLAAVKAVMKALKIDFTIEKRLYNAEFLVKVRRAEDQIKSGKYRKYSASEMPG